MRANERGLAVLSAFRSVFSHGCVNACASASSRGRYILSISSDWRTFARHEADTIALPSSEMVRRVARYVESLLVPFDSVQAADAFDSFPIALR